MYRRLEYFGGTTPSCSTEGCAIEDVEPCTAFGTDLSNATWITSHPCYATKSGSGCEGGYDCTASDGYKTSPFIGISSSGNKACPLCYKVGSDSCTNGNPYEIEAYCKTPSNPPCSSGSGGCLCNSPSLPTGTVACKIGDSWGCGWSNSGCDGCYGSGGTECCDPLSGGC